MKRIIAFIIVLFLFATVCSAADGSEIEDLQNIVPGSADSIIPGGFPDGGFTGDNIGIGLFLNMILRALKGAFPNAAKSFALMIGLLMISSVIGAFRGAVFSKALGEALGFISVLCVCGSAFLMTNAVFSVAEQFISGLVTFLEALIPIVTLLSAAGGNVAFASASSITIYGAMSLLGAVCSSVCMPLLKICFCVSITTAMCGPADLGGISHAVKKLLKYILSIAGIVLSAVLVFQRVITKSADSAALRGLKFTVGSVIPFVGSAIGDALSTLSGSVGVVRATVGISGAVVLCAMVIIPVAELIINKLFLDITSGVASMLGLGKEKTFISQMSDVVGFLIAIVAFIGTFFIIAISVMAGTEVSI